MNFCNSINPYLLLLYAIDPYTVKQFLRSIVVFD